MPEPSQKSGNGFVAVMVSILVVAILAIGAPVWHFARQADDGAEHLRPPKSVDYIALKQYAKGNPAASCIDPAKYVRIKQRNDAEKEAKKHDKYYRHSDADWERLTVADTYRVMTSCVYGFGSRLLDPANERIDKSASLPYSDEGDDFLLGYDADGYDNGDEYSEPNGDVYGIKESVQFALDGVARVQKHIDAGSEKKATAARKAQWKAWTDKWGNPPADPAVAKHAKRLKVQMDQTVDGEQKLIKGVYCASTNNKKVQAAVYVLVGELIADGVQPGKAANTVLKKLDQIECSPASAENARPEPDNGGKWESSGNRDHEAWPSKPR